MKDKSVLAVLTVLFTAMLMFASPGLSDSCEAGGHGNGFPFNFSCIAQLVNYLALSVPVDISCEFEVGIDIDQNFKPTTTKVTTCDNLLRFVSNSDLDLIIVKTDLTTPSTIESRTVLDALGLYIDRNDPGTSCTFYDKFGRVRTNPKPFLNIDAVLRDAPIDDLWFDPKGLSTQHFILMNKPGKSRIFDCSFKLDFFLDPDQIVAVAAGTYRFGLSFIGSADFDSGCDEDSDDDFEDEHENNGHHDDDDDDDDKPCRADDD